jgi:hypothetical protein
MVSAEDEDGRDQYIHGRTLSLVAQRKKGKSWKRGGVIATIEPVTGRRFSLNSHGADVAQARI